MYIIRNTVYLAVNNLHKSLSNCGGGPIYSFTGPPYNFPRTPHGPTQFVDTHMRSRDHHTFFADFTLTWFLPLHIFVRFRPPDIFSHTLHFCSIFPLPQCLVPKLCKPLTHPQILETPSTTIFAWILPPSDICPEMLPPSDTFSWAPPWTKICSFLPPRSKTRIFSTPSDRVIWPPRTQRPFPPPPPLCFFNRKALRGIQLLKLCNRLLRWYSKRKS